MKHICLGAALLLAVVLLSCTRKENDSDEHAHEESLQLTAYNNDLELFAEATPFIKGQTSEILAHFTHLKNFKPLEQGSVTARIIVGAEEVHQTVEQPFRPGIYRFSLNPGKEGSGKIIFDIRTKEGNSQITLPGITVFSNPQEARHEAAEAAVTSSSGVIFTKEQSWKVDFATEEVRQEPFGTIIHTVGQIEPSPGDQRVITAQTSGVVQIGGNELVAGRSVSAGQALLTIDAGGMSDNNLSVRLAEVESEYERARAEYERKAQLAEDQIVSQSDLESARRAFSSAEAQYNHLQRNFRAGRQTVSSPISGFITNMLVYNGQFAEAGQPLLTVSQNKDLFLRADISPHYYEHLLHVTSATLRIPGKERSFTLEELGGELVSFGKSIDVENPLIPVVFQIENRAGLLPGSFLDIYIQTQTSDEALTVANEAVVEEMGNYFVFVQLTPEYFEKRHVKIGKSNGIRTEISEGITEGERVVSKGALLVKLAQTAGALDAHSGHVH